jgi:hypothetical protein
METAFLQFSEPYAWLFRGLVEYGWEDLSLKPQNLPKRYAFNLRPFIETNGKKGVFLHCLALDSNERWFQQDKSYTFVVKLTKDKWDRTVFYMACRELGYYKEHLWVQEQPYYSAGYIHEAVSQEIPKIVDQRRDGWIPPKRPQDDILEIEPSPDLIMYLHQRYSYEQDFNTAIVEGLWEVYSNEPEPYAYQQEYQDPVYQHQIQPEQSPSETPQQNANIQPVIGSGLGRATIGMSTGYGDNEKNALIVKIEMLSNLFLSLSVLGTVIGFFELVNAGFTVYMIAKNMVVNDGDHYYVSIAMNVVFGIYSMLMGLFSYLNNHHFREIQPGWRCWIPIIYAITQPICTPIGIPLAVWAMYLYMKPEFKQYWRG